MKKLILFFACAFVIPVFAGIPIQPAASTTSCDQTRVAAVPSMHRTPSISLIPRRQVLGEDALLPNKIPVAPSNPSIGNELLRSMRIRFQENRGQIADSDGRVRNDIQFVANAPGARLYFRNDGISYVFTNLSSRAQREIPSFEADALSSRAQREIPSFEADALSSRAQREIPESEGISHPAEAGIRNDIEEAGIRNDKLQQYRLDMTLLGANRDARIRAEGELPGYVNYYLPHCPDGITGIREYSRIVYENVYDNVDLELFSVSGRMKYNFVVRPGGDVNSIRMKYDGSAEAALTGSGALAVATPLGRIEEQAPYTYAGEEDNAVGSRFVRHGNTVSFSVDAYDQTETLVIDPWATYYGGSGSEQCYGGITADGDGNVIISGLTYSTNFPVSNAYQPTFGGGTQDAFVVKFDASGNRLWATYYGGTANEWSNGTGVDASGNIVIAGFTFSADFPVSSGAFQTGNAGMSDAFIVKFDAAGSRLWASYYGGSDREYCNDVAVDAAGTIVFTGDTRSTNFPVSSNAYQKSKAKGPANSSDAFLVKFTGSGSRSWATYFGGKGFDFGEGVVIDGSSNVLFSGITTSNNLPVTSGAFQLSLAGAQDAFVAKFTSAGGRSWASYYGGSNNDYSWGIATDGGGNAIAVGTTESSNFPVSTGAFQTSLASYRDAFIVKLNAANGSRQWGTFYGGSGNEEAGKPRCDAAGGILFPGGTGSTDFPVSADALQGAYGGDAQDAFIVKLFPDGSRNWATYYGGSYSDYATGGFVDGSGNVLITGSTLSYDFPLFGNSYQSTNAGADAFVVVLNATGHFTKRAAENSQLPSTLRLEQNYPNPFNPSTTITYGIRRDGHVLLDVLDVHGCVVTELVNDEKTAGTHSVVFDAYGLPSGVYRYRLEANGEIRSGTMTFLK